MTIDIAADRVIIEAATPGPWTAANRGVYSQAPAFTEYGGNVCSVDSDADTTFIREARTRWPAALDEIVRLRAALEWYATWLGAPGNYPNIAANEDRGERARAALDGDKK